MRDREGGRQGGRGKVEGGRREEIYCRMGVGKWGREILEYSNN